MTWILLIFTKSYLVKQNVLTGSTVASSEDSVAREGYIGHGKWFAVLSSLKIWRLCKYPVERCDTVPQNLAFSHVCTHARTRAHHARLTYARPPFNYTLLGKPKERERSETLGSFVTKHSSFRPSASNRQGIVKALTKRRPRARNDDGRFRWRNCSAAVNWLQIVKVLRGRFLPKESMMPF